jgi:selT/selW/selH-like putative selenoprotein
MSTNAASTTTRNPGPPAASSSPVAANSPAAVSPAAVSPGAVAASTPAALSQAAAAISATHCGSAASAGAVRVRIEYCEIGNYLGPARGLAASLRHEFRGQGVSCELSPSCGGAFEVFVNGRLVFSKRATSRLPDASEIYYHVATAQMSAGR